METVSAGLDITQPAEIGLYVQVFDLLQRSAVHGHGARDLIRRALREDIFPDPQSASLAGSWHGGAVKALERQNAALLQAQPAS